MVFIAHKMRNKKLAVPLYTSLFCLLFSSCDNKLSKTEFLTCKRYLLKQNREKKKEKRNQTPSPEYWWDEIPCWSEKQNRIVVFSAYVDFIPELHFIIEYQNMLHFPQNENVL